ncbi:NADPH-dependent FMN reductase [Peterkaempfera bronchialis]|uniref:FMN reductase (NADPH) n=1 Tax=Peterkaempfera bronchialis TaxID=2126346 RepID=A0A345T2J5_9ACTN|nr:NADPH-dependent FMN reductase [Peterkaempfera bronchialis]AXI80200.1 FMN reductase (NADPH) [Peterkaempfera bronchialis]
MARVLTLSGSPSATSRTTRLLGEAARRLDAQHHQVTAVEVRRLPADVLTGSDIHHPAVTEIAELIREADGVVVGTPIYKAAYSGLLKCLLDLLPQYALAGKTVLPLATGGSPAHVLAVDYALRPVLSSMGAAHITPGWFVLDSDILATPDGATDLAPAAAIALDDLVNRFSAALGTSVG